MDIERVRAASWTQTVDTFIEAATYLSDEDIPQLKALYGIASILDRGGKIQAALVSQFTLTQRTLAAKGLKAARPTDPERLDELLDSDDPEERAGWLQSPM